MANYQTSKNQMIDILLIADYVSNGWSFIDGKAVHSGVNHGSIVNSSFNPEPGKLYTIRFNVSTLSPGFLEVGMGGVVYGNITATGEYNLSMQAVDDSPFYLKAGADNIVVDFVEISSGIVDSETLVYDADSKLYNGNISVFGDFMMGFFDDLVVFREGRPWIQDKNTKRNNFFGVQFPSVIKYYCNIEYEKDKDFYSFVINGNKPWTVDIAIDSFVGKSKGQRSRIKHGNFSLEKGVWKAPVLRDMNDPRFSDELQALMKGAYIQGKIMEVTLTSNSDEFTELITVDVNFAIK